MNVFIPKLCKVLYSGTLGNSGGKCEQICSRCLVIEKSLTKVLGPLYFVSLFPNRLRKMDSVNVSLLRVSRPIFMSISTIAHAPQKN